MLKPSEITPLNAIILAEEVHKAGFPPGTFNLVHGDGPTVGEAICAHPAVDMISFTGSTRAGRRVTEIGAKSIKKVKTELGGKSAHIILDDVRGAEFSKAVSTSVLSGVMVNSGQTCTALTRLLVPRSMHDDACAIAKMAAEKVRVGYADDEKAFVGPLSSKAQQQRVLNYISKGCAEGATLVAGGPGMPDGCATGFFVKPTVFGNVTNDMTIAQEEIFGPVVCILPYDSVDEAVMIANDSIYGLSGAVTSSAADPARALAVAMRIRTGELSVNGGKYNPRAPFGGFKQSGNGREKGLHGLYEFLETKSIQVKFSEAEARDMVCKL